LFIVRVVDGSISSTQTQPNPTNTVAVFDYTLCCFFVCGYHKGYQ